MSLMKKIMIVDDSALMRRVFCDIINSIDGFQVVKTCRDGVEALEALQSSEHYDAMILDVEMPRMDGIRLLREIQDRGINITTLMASTYTTENADITIRCMELGAVDFIAKPEDISKLKTAGYRAKIETMLKVVSKYNVSEVRTKIHTVKTELPHTQTPATAKQTAPAGGNRIIALACSTGGPKSLQSVIPYLSKNMDAPCVLVQHMPVGFTKSLADRLNEISEVEVSEAVDGETLKKGHVYIAPGGRHMEIAAEAGGVHRIRLNEKPAIGGLRPCANVMYRSLSNSKYDEIVCVVLTGMGADGTEGIVELSKHKKTYVISQDAQTSIVYGMPKAIAETGLSNEVLPLELIAGAAMKRVGVCR